MQKSPRVLLTYCNSRKEGFQRDFVAVHELKRASKLKMSSNRPPRPPFGIDGGDQDYNHSSDNIDKTRYCQITSLRTSFNSTRNNITSQGMKPILLTRQRSNVFELVKEMKQGFLIMLFWRFSRIMLWKFNTFILRDIFYYFSNFTIFFLRRQTLHVNLKLHFNWRRAGR